MDTGILSFLGQYKGVTWLLLALFWVYVVFVSAKITKYQKKVSGFIVWPAGFIIGFVGLFGIPFIVFEAPAFVGPMLFFILLIVSIVLCFLDESRSERRLREIKEGVAELKS